MRKDTVEDLVAIVARQDAQIEKLKKVNRNQKRELKNLHAKHANVMEVLRWKNPPGQNPEHWFHEFKKVARRFNDLQRYAGMKYVDGAETYPELELLRKAKKQAQDWINRLAGGMAGIQTGIRGVTQAETPWIVPPSNVPGMFIPTTGKNPNESTTTGRDLGDETDNPSKYPGEFG